MALPPADAAGPFKPYQDVTRGQGSSYIIPVGYAATGSAEAIIVATFWYRAHGVASSLPCWEFV